MKFLGLNSPEIFIILAIVLIILGPRKIEKGWLFFQRLLKFLLSNEENFLKDKSKIGSKLEIPSEESELKEVKEESLEVKTEKAELNEHKEESLEVNKEESELKEVKEESLEVKTEKAELKEVKGDSLEVKTDYEEVSQVEDIFLEANSKEDKPEEKSKKAKKQ